MGNASDDLCLSRRGLFASTAGRRNDAMLRCTGDMARSFLLALYSTTLIPNSKVSRSLMISTLRLVLESDHHSVTRDSASNREPVLQLSGNG